MENCYSNMSTSLCLQLRRCVRVCDSIFSLTGLVLWSRLHLAYFWHFRGLKSKYNIIRLTLHLVSKVNSLMYFLLCLPVWYISSLLIYVACLARTRFKSWMESYPSEILTVWCEVWNGGAEFRVWSLREDGESPQSACLNGARVSQGTVSVLVRRSASYPEHLALMDGQEWWRGERETHRWITVGKCYLLHKQPFLKV